jgi:hypothetical protein
MKASAIITVHYRNSICTITAVQTMLTYVIEITYPQGYYKNAGVLLFIPCAESYTPNMVNRSWYIGSISSRPLLENQRSVRITDGKANSPVSWGSLPPYLIIEGVVTECKVGLCINLSFDRKVMLVVRVIYIYIIATSISPISITLGFYVLSKILNETNIVLPNTLLAKLLYWKYF